MDNLVPRQAQPLATGRVQRELTRSAEHMHVVAEVSKKATDTLTDIYEYQEWRVLRAVAAANLLNQAAAAASGRMAGDDVAAQRRTQQFLDDVQALAKTTGEQIIQHIAEVQRQPRPRNPFRRAWDSLAGR